MVDDPARCVRLRDGTRAEIRPIEPDDKRRLQEGLRRLSPRSRYLRFHSPVDKLSDQALRYLTEVDYRDHMAWVATNPDDAGEPGMGVARYIRLADDDGVAEAAVTVLDEYQGRGLGTALLDVLATSAARNGIRTFRNYVLAENVGMLELLDHTGAERYDEGGGVYRLDMPVPSVVADPHDSPSGGLLRAVARGHAPPLLDALARLTDHGWLHEYLAGHARRQ